MYPDLDGKVALVTGGAGGMGAATAKRLVAEGAFVAIADINGKLVEEYAGGLDPARTLPLVVDVGDPTAVDDAIGRTVKRFGKLDLVHNNAGLPGTTKALIEVTPQEYQELYRVNERGVFLVLRASMIQMLKQGTGGSIVNTASSAGRRGFDQRGPYCAGKHAVVGVTKAAAIEAGPHGVRVNGICPGPINTQLISSVIEKWGEGDQDAGMAGMLSRVPLGRIGQPEEVAALVCWLLSDEASFISGALYTIDGGADAY